MALPPDIDPRLVEAVAARLLEGVQGSPTTMGALWGGFWSAQGSDHRSARDTKARWASLDGYRFPDGRRLSEMRPSEVGYAFPALYREWRRRQQTRRGRAPATATINRELERLRAVLNWAVGAGAIPPHPLCRMHMDREDNVKRSKVRGEEEFERLLQACAEEHHALPALVLLYYDGGLRRMEGMWARWEDLEHKIGGGGLLKLWRTKNAKIRHAHLTKRTMLQIGALPRVSPWLFANVRIYQGGRKSKFYGRPYNPTYLYRHFQAAVIAAELEPAEGEEITFHTLRHSFAYRARRRWKWPEQVIMRQGGWATRSAFDRYGISDDDELAEAMGTAETAIAEDTRRPPKSIDINGNHVSKSIRMVTRK